MAALGAASATPEILNVRELELPKHGENEKGEVIGELDLKQNRSFKPDADDHRFDDEMDAQENDDAVVENENHNHSNEPMQHFISTNAF